MKMWTPEAFLQSEFLYSLREFAMSHDEQVVVLLGVDAGDKAPYTSVCVLREAHDA